jgi:hypothetical protein
MPTWPTSPSASMAAPSYMRASGAPSFVHGCTRQLRWRATLIPIQPLDGQRAALLLEQIAPNIDLASKTTILRQAQGHPQTIMAYAERLATHGNEERHAIEPFKLPGRWLNFVLMFAVLVTLILIQRHISNDIAGAVLSGAVVMTMWYLRPRFREVTKK